MELFSNLTASNKSLVAQAYERLEAMIVNCRLAPGSSVTLQALQEMVSLGRTPVYEAVHRLAEDTLVTILPRSGLRIAPIDIQREQMLLQVRRPLERFVTQLAARNATPEQRTLMSRLVQKIQLRRNDMDVDTFNTYDFLLDKLMLESCAEPLLSTTLRPLHTIFRRSGWLYLSHSGDGAPHMLEQCIITHLAVLETVIAGNETAASEAADRLIDLSENMFHTLQKTVSPALLNVTGDRQARSPSSSPPFIGAHI